MTRRDRGNLPRLAHPENMGGAMTNFTFGPNQE